MDGELRRRSRNKQRRREQQLKNRIITSGILLLTSLFIVFAGVSGCGDRATVNAEAAGTAEEAVGIEEEAAGTAEEAAETEGEPAGSAEETGTEVTDASAEDTLPENSVYQELKNELKELVEGEAGAWSIYVKDLNNGASVSINNQPMYAASLIKLFVMEESYEAMDSLVSNVCLYEDMDETRSLEKISNIMFDMIAASDNESYNEMVRLQSLERSFTEGCLLINAGIEEEGFDDTGIYHTLSPSDTESEATQNIRNHTSVADCGRLLEEIYNGTCVSREASEEMLELLLQQEVRNKIPSVLPEGILVANKTGETEEVQHDAAIVYGEETDYILCVMSSDIDSEEQAVSVIQKISSAVYEYLNPEKSSTL